MTETAIELRDLAIGYGRGRDRRVVAGGINATVMRGRLTCLVGSNGVGKSTLLRTLAAFQPKLGGSIMMGGRDIAEYSRLELSRLVGVVLTERPPARSLTVEQMVGMGRSPYTGFFGKLTDADRRIVAESLSMAGISKLSGRMMETLSDGERQKVMTAKALAQQTSVVYLDEPTAFLDYGSKVSTMQLLRRLCHEEQKTIFLSTHDVEIALQTADILWVMTGEGITTGTPRELADDGTLGRFINRPGLRFDAGEMRICVE